MAQNRPRGWLIHGDSTFVIITHYDLQHFRTQSLTINANMLRHVCLYISEREVVCLNFFSGNCDGSAHRVDKCTEMRYDDERVITISKAPSWSILCHAIGLNALHPCLRNEARYT